jgi:hypothetical protein
MSSALQRSILGAAAIFVAATFAATAAQTGTDSGAVVQSNGPPVKQNTSPPKLELSDAERTRIAKTVAGHETDVSFALKTAKPAAQFKPAIGEKLPQQLKAHSLPPPLIYQMPELKQYEYVKLRDQVLIVNPMNKTIVDLIPIAQ